MCRWVEVGGVWNSVWIGWCASRTSSFSSLLLFLLLSRNDSLWHPVGGLEHVVDNLPVAPSCPRPFMHAKLCLRGSHFSPPSFDGQKSLHSAPESPYPSLRNGLSEKCACMHQRWRPGASTPFFLRSKPSRLAFPMLLPDFYYSIPIIHGVPILPLLEDVPLMTSGATP